MGDMKAETRSEIIALPTKYLVTKILKIFLFFLCGVTMLVVLSLHP
jgi:hypothetical protein